ncbi:MAG TPA: TonB-dependent receptor, partial [Chloroflexota bacterium]|nr:TonB-dependent receptor [Chloroflexota bacterium]
KYSYDGDWGNPEFWAPLASVYQYSEIQDRDRTTKTVELRLGTESDRGFGWLVGVYGNQLDESLIDTSLGDYQPLGTPVDPSSDQSNVGIHSAYRARNGALYGELDWDLAAGLRASFGLRGERWSATYAGTTTDFLGSNTGYTNAPVEITSILGATTARLNPTEDLWGGHASLTEQLDETSSVYLTLSRGYKAGGFNLSQGLLPSQLFFNPESDLNGELGYKADLANHRLAISADVFYLYRRDAQIKTSFQSDPTNPDDFVFYTGNAASGHNYGLESEAAWRASSLLTLSADLGLLQTYFKDFVQQGVSGRSLLTVSRELANAPHWQAAVSATYRDPRGLMARLDVTGMGAYYFDLPPNETTSKPYGLVNGK